MIAFPLLNWLLKAIYLAKGHSQYEHKLSTHVSLTIKWPQWNWPEESFKKYWLLDRNTFFVV